MIVDVLSVDRAIILVSDPLDKLLFLNLVPQSIVMLFPLCDLLLVHEGSSFVHSLLRFNFGGAFLLKLQQCFFDLRLYHIFVVVCIHSVLHFVGLFNEAPLVVVSETKIIGRGLVLLVSLGCLHLPFYFLFSLHHLVVLLNGFTGLLFLLDAVLVVLIGSIAVTLDSLLVLKDFLLLLICSFAHLLIDLLPREMCELVFLIVELL